MEELDKKEIARLKKNERQREYAKRTGHEASKKAREKLAGMSFYFPPSFVDSFKAKCKANGVSQQSLIKQWIADYIASEST